MKLDENELNMAKMLIENMTGPFVAVDTTGPSNVIDLMEALQKSLELSKHSDKESQKRLTGTA